MKSSRQNIALIEYDNTKQKSGEERNIYFKTNNKQNTALYAMKLELSISGYRDEHLRRWR